MFSRPSLVYLFLITLLACYLPFSNAGNNKTDWLALREIKARINNDPLGVLSSWNDSLHFCQWHGVTCGRRHRRVISLELYSSKLTGTLSPFIGNLSFLRLFSLYNNSFSGAIPAEIGHLHMLQNLELSNNSFGGNIPSNLSACINLLALDLTKNKLVGAIPSRLGSLINLQFLSFQNNYLIGSIPSSLGNLTFLSTLSISMNHLTSTIPDSLGRLKKLTRLIISQNELSGIVPTLIFNLSFLTDLGLGENHLEGSLPLHLGFMLPFLSYLSLGSNNFTGAFPTSVANLSNLHTLDLDSNDLRGPVPSLHKLKRLQRLSLWGNFLGRDQPTDLNFVSSLVNATTLEVLDIGQNNLKGNFPSTICNFSMLSRLGLWMNKMEGQVPFCVENMANLGVFDAFDNHISGLIPSSIGKLQNLHTLDLSLNEFSGYIPSSIGNLTQLNILYLEENYLEGHIPSTIGNFRYLMALDLSRNNLRGRVPLQLFNLSCLTVGLDLSHNPLTRSLPKEVGQLKNLVVLAIAYTMLSGDIPSTLGACITLESLHMQGNHFQGAIPPSFSALRGLQFLDLSHNNLSGNIPKFLEGFPLQMLNLSYNNFDGEVPFGGIFSNETGLSIAGNSGLCGGMHELTLPPCTFKKTQTKRLGHKRRLIIAIFGGFFGVVLLVVSISVYAFCHKKGRNEPKGDSKFTLPNLSYRDILKATNGLSSKNLIGTGTFGRVYKAVLDPGQTTVAIKIFNLVHRGASKSFMAECQVLRNIRHRNLLKVITTCSSVDYKGIDFKALVYEYMGNGSLEDWLHQKRIGNIEGTTSASPRKLNLPLRIDIVVDVAFALEYLHHYFGASIVHCDLKPSNVLLDDEMVAHVGDFGLAKFLSNGITSSQANQSSSVGVRGTIGYAPPEYGLGNELSTLGDVYSFGILLLEMLTGKKPTDDMFKEGLSLHGFVKAAWPEHVMEILDHVLLEDIVGEDMNNIDHTGHLLRTNKSEMILEALTSILDIALSCCAELPQERLDMSVVAPKLSSIKDKLLGTQSPERRQMLDGAQGQGY